MGAHYNLIKGRGWMPNVQPEILHVCLFGTIRLDYGPKSDKYQFVIALMIRLQTSEADLVFM